MSLNFWLEIIPLSKLERKRHMELRPSTVEFPNNGEIICKINRINIINRINRINVTIL